MCGDEQADRLLLGREQIGAVELWRWDRSVARGRERRRGLARATRLRREVEDRSLADLGVRLGVLPRALRLLEHRQHALARIAGRPERAGLDQGLDRFLFHGTVVDARAEVEQVLERNGGWVVIAPGGLDRFDRGVPDALDG